MGLPSQGNTRADISSDSQSESGSDDDREKPGPTEMATQTKKIAKMWLNQGRGQSDIQSSKSPLTAGKQQMDISDDSGTDEESEKPAVALSAQTQAIAKKWLSGLMTSHHLIMIKMTM